MEPAEWISMAKAAYTTYQVVKTYADKDKEQNAYFSSSVAAAGRALHEKWAEEKRVSLEEGEKHVKSVYDVYEWWRDIAFRDIKKYGISKTTIENGNLNAYIQGEAAQVKILHNAIAFFEKEERWPKYASLGAVILANHLLVAFALGTDAIHSAIQSKHVTAPSAAALKAGIASLQTWKSYYQKRRTDILAISELTSHTGKQEGFFGGRASEPNGIHQVVFDEADGILPGFGGKRDTDKDAVKPFTEANIVHTAFEKCKANVETIPNAINEMRQQVTRGNASAARAGEGLALSTQAPPSVPSSTFDGKTWYRLSNLGLPGLSLDVVNDGAGNQAGAINMANSGNFSGQYWVIHPQPTSGFYYLSSQYHGAGTRLDVYGDDKTRPHLAAAGNFSGQNWKVTEWGDGTWKLTNEYSEDELHLDTKEGSSSELRLATGDSPTQHWRIEAITSVTQAEFL